MKINFFNTIISIGISIVFSYGSYIFNQEKEYCKLITFVPAIFVCITLIFTIGIRIENKKHSTGIKSISIIFLILYLCLAIIFSITKQFNQNIFFIVYSILALLYALLIKTIIKS